MQDKVFHLDYTYCMPGHFIHDNISFIREAMDMGRNSSSDFGLLF